MPVHDLSCTSCSNVNRDILYRSALDTVACSNCGVVGQLSICYLPGESKQRTSIGYNYQRGDLVSQAPGSFREVLGAIGKGVKKGEAGSSIEKYM